jgi:hypothetical protein
VALRIAYLTADGRIWIHPVKDWKGNEKEAQDTILRINIDSRNLAMAQLVDDWKD